MNRELTPDEQRASVIRETERLLIWLARAQEQGREQTYGAEITELMESLIPELEVIADHFDAPEVD